MELDVSMQGPFVGLRRCDSECDLGVLGKVKSEAKIGVRSSQIQTILVSYHTEASSGSHETHSAIYSMIKIQ